ADCTTLTSAPALLTADATESNVGQASRSSTPLRCAGSRTQLTWTTRIAALRTNRQRIRILHKNSCLHKNQEERPIFARPSASFNNPSLPAAIAPADRRQW